MADIVISEFMDGAAVERLSSKYATAYDPTLVDNPDALSDMLGDARALIVRNRTQVRSALLENATKLQCVGRLGVGLDNIDTTACEGRNIAVYPASGANDLSVAEYVVTAALNLLRGAWHSSEAVIRGEWPRQKLMGRELSGRMMGLVGYGAIAREVASRVEALGMSVIGYDPFLAADDPLWGNTGQRTLQALLGQADVVSLHVPLTEDTKRMINGETLSLMKSDAILINAARGGVVDEKALAEALRNKTLGGAALDVFETEPLSAEAGAIFAGLSNILLTPHIAGVTEESNIRVSHLIADKVIADLEGQA